MYEMYERFTEKAIKVALPALEYAAGAKQLLNLASCVAQELDHDHIGPEHLLLGLIREGGGLAVEIIQKLGVEKGELQQRVLELMDEE